jgi:2-aminoethylphosphonate-pyruvate transaminase
MSLFSRDPILLTPGPITTSLETKMAMLRDWGSWDANFNAVTAEVPKEARRDRQRPGHARLRPGAGQRHVFGRGGDQYARPAQRPRAGPDQRCRTGLRLAKLTQMMGRKVTTFETPEDVPTTPADVDRLLKADPSITHVGLITAKRRRAS